MASTNPLVVKRGALWKGLTVNFSISGVPVDLTGAYILLQVKKNPCDEDPQLELSTENGGIVIDNPATGTFSVEPTVIDLIPRIYTYDIYCESTNRKDYLIEPSTFEVEANVSRQTT